MLPLLVNELKKNEQKGIFLPQLYTRTGPPAGLVFNAVEQRERERRGRRELRRRRGSWAEQGQDQVAS